jgi:hypothetical protein
VIAFILVFLAAVVADVCWTMYFVEVGNKHALRAALWSGAIVACGAYSTVEYVSNHWLFLAAVAGSIVGTYGTLKWGKKE